MSTTRRAGLLLLAVRTARVLARQANQALDNHFRPDPWTAALALRRIERIARAIASSEAPAARRDWATQAVAAVESELRERLQRRESVRTARWAGLRPPLLLAQQAERQLQILGAQCNHRELLLNPIERIETATSALQEIVAELDMHELNGTLPTQQRALRDHAREAIASMNARVERVRALRVITPPELLLAMAMREAEAGTETLRTAALAPTAALGLQRRLLETELLVLTMALAFGTPDTVAALRRVQRARRRAGRLAEPALRPSRLPAAEDG